MTPVEAIVSAFLESYREVLSSKVYAGTVVGRVVDVLAFKVIFTLAIRKSISIFSSLTFEFEYDNFPRTLYFLVHFLLLEINVNQRRINFKLVRGLMVESYHHFAD